MEKDRLYELLEKKLRQTLSPEEKIQLHEILVNNSEMKKASDVISKMKIDYNIDKVELEQRYNSSWQRVSKEIVELGNQPNKVSLKKYMAAVAVASIALIVVASLSYFSLKQPSMEFVENLDTANKNIVLADGSQVTLRTGTKISFPKNFTLKKRIVNVVGEAFFNVAKDSERPFIVKTDAVDIKVLGTSFNVRSEQEDDAVEVVLETGSISLSKSDDKDMPVLLKPNEKAIIDKADGKITVSTADASLYTIWKEDVLIFKSQPLKNIAKMLEATYKVSIQIKGESISNQLYTGEFKKKNSINDILDIIKLNTPFTYSIENNLIIIEKENNIAE